MQIKTKKTLKIGLIFFAIIGLALTTLIGIALLSPKTEAVFSEDVQLLQQIYTNAIPTRYGVVMKRAEDHNGQVAVEYYLVRLLGKQTFAQGKEQLVVVGYVKLRPDITTKVVNDEIDLGQTAEALPLNMLVNTASENWWGSAGYLKKKKDDTWEETVWQDGLFQAGPSATGPAIAFPILSPKHKSFSVKDTSDARGYTHYFSVIGKEIKENLGFHSSFDDLNDCLADIQHMNDVAQSKLNQTPDDVEVSTDNTEDEEPEPEDSADYTCVRAIVTVKPIKKVTANFYDLEATIEGEGQDQIHRKQHYILKYWPSENRYAFKRWQNGILESDFLAAFALEGAPKQ